MWSDAVVLDVLVKEVDRFFHLAEDKTDLVAQGQFPLIYNARSTARRYPFSLIPCPPPLGPLILPADLVP